jgi:DNA invertase Pin-like site-specific DNA recombinase
MKEIKVIETPNITYSNYQMLKRVAAYARVSTKLEMQSSSLALQIKHYAKEIIFNPDYVFAGVYADHGKSGTSMKKRDGLQSLLKKVYGGHIDLVLVKSLSRFARNTLDALNIIKKTRKLGVEFYFEKENISSLDPAIDMLFTMMASMAESESESMSQNISWSFQKNAQKGKVPLKKCIGYQITVDKKYVIDEVIAPHIKKLFQMKLEGYSNQELINYLNHCNVTTTQNNPFTTTSQVKNILTDEKYIGQSIYGETYTKKMNNEKVTTINTGEMPKYIIRNHHEAIIDDETFKQVQEIIKGQTRKHIPREKNPYNQYIYSLMHDKYLHWKKKIPNKPEYDLLENEYKRKQGTPRIHTKTATHVTRKATIALARKFSDLEAKFDKQVSKQLNNKPLERKLKNSGNDLKAFKDEYFKILNNTELDPASIALINELEDIIIKKSIDYVRLADEASPQQASTSRIKAIKKAIASIELPMEDLPIEKIKQIFNKIVIVDQENYVFVINTTDKSLEKEALKKVAEMNPLLESKCKAKNRGVEFVNWKIIII